MILNRNRTTWANTDTRLTPKLFYEPTRKKIAIREMGGGYDFMYRTGKANDSKHDKGMGEATVELESLIHGQRMGRNSAGNSKCQAL